MVDHFRSVSDPVRLFFSSSEVPERFEVAVVHPQLPVSLGEELGIEIVVAARGKMPDGHTSLAMSLGKE